ncbi:MAG TPA: site-2 protease family protein [Burkholderiales bacterium]|nr:site-2 protease family protein [Burkholderiales bacterium]
MTTGGFTLGRVAGIEVYVHASLLIVLALVSFSLATGLLPAWHPDWSAAMRWTFALVASVLLVASVAVHELAHAWVGRAGGIPVWRVTLFVFGGMAHLEAEPRSWRVELWTALAGPAASLALGASFVGLGVALGAHETVDAQPGHLLAAIGPTATLLLWLGQINVVLAAFNMLPGFPLDGGRVLRALIWRSSGNMLAATRFAARSGQALSWLLIGVGLAMVFGLRLPLLGGGPAAGTWLALMGWFLNAAALAGYRDVTLRAEVRPLAKAS